jgi:hypothetical protein
MGIVKHPRYKSRFETDLRLTASDCPYLLAALSATHGFDLSDWPPGEDMAKFFQGDK